MFGEVRVQKPQSRKLWVHSAIFWGRILRTNHADRAVVVQCLSVTWSVSRQQRVSDVFKASPPKSSGIVEVQSILISMLCHLVTSRCVTVCCKNVSFECVSVSIIAALVCDLLCFVLNGFIHAFRKRSEGDRVGCQGD